MPKAYVKGLSITQKCREERTEPFLKNVLKTESCWLWTGSKHPSGYGFFYVPGTNGKSIGAHRASWLLFRGDQPEGMVVCHKCNVPACVNPDHLFLDTQHANALDCVKKGPTGARRGSLTPHLSEVRFVEREGIR